MEEEEKGKKKRNGISYYCLGVIIKIPISKSGSSPTVSSLRELQPRAKAP